MLNGTTNTPHRRKCRNNGKRLLFRRGILNGLPEVELSLRDRVANSVTIIKVKVAKTVCRNKRGTGVKSVSNVKEIMGMLMTGAE